MALKRITNLLSWVVVMGVIGYFAYMRGWILADFESVSPAEAQALLQKEGGTVLLDVRTPQEFAQERIAGASSLPLGSLEANLPKLEPFKNKTIVVYCQSGMRSVAAARILQRNGFKPVNLEGGIGAWESEGLKLEH